MFDYQRVFLPFTGRLPLQPLTWWAKELLMMLAAADDFVVSLDISFFGRCNPPPATWVCPSIWYPASSALWLLWCFVYTMFFIISAPNRPLCPISEQNPHPRNGTWDKSSRKMITRAKPASMAVEASSWLATMCNNLCFQTVTRTSSCWDGTCAPQTAGDTSNHHHQMTRWGQYT